MRRLGPRPLARALPNAMRHAQPPTLLARVQAAWPQVAGPAVAAAAAPVTERDGVVTVACESGGWAMELELLQRELRSRLHERLGAADAARPIRLRFVVGSPPNRR